MLNQAICRQCINAMAELPIYVDDAKGLTWREWNEGDIEAWEKDKMVHCRLLPALTCLISINGLPPKHCKYAVEHVVSEPC
jgi:hypothetical protein